MGECEHKLAGVFSPYDAFKSCVKCQKTEVQIVRGENAELKARNRRLIAGFNLIHDQLFRDMSDDYLRGYCESVCEEMLEIKDGRK